MNKGFSIVEAMVIVTIIGILATIVYSRYNHHIAKTRQAEAKNNLNHLTTLQEAYILEHNQYYFLTIVGLNMSGGHKCSDSTPGEELLNDLGFRPRNCRELRYGYRSPQHTKTGFTGTPPRFTMRADSNPANTGVYIWPDCNSRDMWRVHKQANGGGGHVHQPDDNEFNNTGRQRRVLDNCK